MSAPSMSAAAKAASMYSLRVPRSLTMAMVSPDLIRHSSNCFLKSSGSFPGLVDRVLRSAGIMAWLSLKVRDRSAARADVQYRTLFVFMYYEQMPLGRISWFTRNSGRSRNRLAGQGEGFG